MALGAEFENEGLRVELAPFVVGVGVDERVLELDDISACGGLSEPSGPSLSAWAVSVVVSTIAIEWRRGVVNVLVSWGCNIDMCGIGVVVGDDDCALRRSLNTGVLGGVYRDIMTDRHGSERVVEGREEESRRV